MTHSSYPKRGQRTEKSLSRKEASASMGNMMNRKVSKTKAMHEKVTKKQK